MRRDVDELSMMRLARWLGMVWPPDITPRERGFAAHICKENSAKPEIFKLRHSAILLGGLDWRPSNFMRLAPESRCPARRSWDASYFPLLCSPYTGS